jgi:hypothetical protein
MHEISDFSIRELRELMAPNAGANEKRRAPQGNAPFLLGSPAQAEVLMVVPMRWPLVLTVGATAACGGGGGGGCRCARPACRPA